MNKILLIEPKYKNKYPPLGLMKIASYHKMKGDYVLFVKGLDSEIKDKNWDKIYISTLFTFYWKETVDTIAYYLKSVKNTKDIIVGGVLATLLKKDLLDIFDITVVEGLLTKGNIICPNTDIDALVPDYSILSDVEYKYPLSNAYITYSSKGCVNKCDFCAVHILEPKFIDYRHIKNEIQMIDRVYGEKKDLVLMDNNVFASKNFDRIITDIIDLGFHKGAKFKNKLRYVDFNQGTDARLVTEEKMKLLSKIAIKPLRIAFDNISMKNVYTKAIKIAQQNGLLSLSNYVLFNYKDTPSDFYERLKINCLLNEDLGTKIYSFPMKYVPLNAKDRKYIGKHWNKKMLRAIQCILLVTKGKVGGNIKFFEAAFGSSFDEFQKISMMPEDYIIYREKHKNNGALDWYNKYSKLSSNEKELVVSTTETQTQIKKYLQGSCNYRIKNVLEHYLK